MSNDTVLQSLESGLLTITMNRPERRNALNPDMTLGLVAAAQRAAEDHEVRAVLLKGAGGTFCVGGDVKSMAEGRSPMPFEARMTNLRRAMEVSRILHEMSKPVVAQLDGAAAGAGLSIALACDLRVASETVKITTAFAKVGLSGDYGGTYFLTQMLGSAKARELYLMSPVLTAREALALGLVTRVVADAEIDAAARELAMSLAQGPSITLGYSKRNINNAELIFYTSRRVTGEEACRMGLANECVPQDQVRSAAMKLAQEIAECSPLGLLSTRATMRAGLADRVMAATHHELAEQTRLRATEDFKEGVKATEERRVPNFRGR